MNINLEKIESDGQNNINEIYKTGNAKLLENESKANKDLAKVQEERQKKSIEAWKSYFDTIKQFFEAVKKEQDKFKESVSTALSAFNESFSKGFSAIGNLFQTQFMDKFEKAGKSFQSIGDNFGLILASITANSAAMLAEGGHSFKEYAISTIGTLQAIFNAYIIAAAAKDALTSLFSGAFLTDLAYLAIGNALFTGAKALIGKKTGGFVFGGTNTSDSVPTMLSNQEYVVPSYNGAAQRNAGMLEFIRQTGRDAREYYGNYTNNQNVRVFGKFALQGNDLIASIDSTERNQNAKFY